MGKKFEDFGALSTVQARKFAADFVKSLHYNILIQFVTVVTVVNLPGWVNVSNTLQLIYFIIPRFSAQYHHH